jgi:GAF domain-containing protein
MKGACGSTRHRARLVLLRMHEIRTTPGLAKAEAYRELNRQLAALFSGEPSGLANAANMAAVLFRGLPGLNWAGFYFLAGGELVLGPFQGKVACVRIAMGRGVCGTAAAQRRTLVVPDVDAFAGHIACDSASRSEIVVPLVQAGRLIGVLDVDSPSLARFDGEDAAGLEAGAALLVAASDFGRLSD